MIREAHGQPGDIMASGVLMSGLFILALLVLSGCVPQASERAESIRVDKRPGATTGVTVFGDARLGIAIN
jgi:hypothetical protein